MDWILGCFSWMWAQHSICDEPSWPSKMRHDETMEAVKPLRVFLVLLLDIVHERKRYSEFRCPCSLLATQEEDIGIVIHQILRRITSQKGHFSWPYLGIVHSVPMWVSAWCWLWPPSNGIVMPTWCILARVYDGVVQLVFIATNP